METSNTFYEKYALLVVLGHYGSGKTNLALNLAKKLSDLGRPPLVVDLDVVNPYFRTTDYQELTDREGIEVVGPVFGNSSLDAPSLAPGIDSMIREASLQRPVILDVGGDPDGARALVRYAPEIRSVENRLTLLVVNARRPESQQVEDNLMMIGAISGMTNLPIEALIGNTHLAEFTTFETIEQSLELLEELSTISRLPLMAVTIPAGLTVPPGSEDLYLPIERLVRTSWQ
ncbi:MAG: hypothetical protein LBP91_02735 [Coriobacteriales bacterium]|jgi:hypothetical protein|nr:hypothetical protein [Coriobacteriales bacterium]